MRSEYTANLSLQNTMREVTPSWTLPSRCARKPARKSLLRRLLGL